MAGASDVSLGYNGAEWTNAYRKIESLLILSSEQSVAETV